MSHELHYTSVPRGLAPGSRGFCTVATTPSLSRPLVERLESLSGYQPVFPPGDAAETLNPITYLHVKVSVGAKLFHVLSRVGPAGLDYSSRPNKYAHHVVLDPSETSQGGPAWLLRQPGFVDTQWIGEPRGLATGRIPPRGDRPATIATAWQAMAGDPGWAGALAEAFLADPRRPIYLVFQPGMELLPLFEEAIALLPPSRRWDVEFSTYFSQLPQGISCSWRGVLDGSSEAAQAARLPGAMVIDLCHPSEQAVGGSLVHQARTGERIDATEVSTEVSLRAQPGLDRALPESKIRRSFDAKSISLDREFDLIPEMAARMAPGRSRQRGRSAAARTLVAAFIAGVLGLAFAIVVLMNRASNQRAPRDNAAKILPALAPVSVDRPAVRRAAAPPAARDPQAAARAPRAIAEPETGKEPPDKSSTGDVAVRPGPPRARAPGKASLRGGFLDTPEIAAGPPRVTDAPPGPLVVPGSRARPKAIVPPPREPLAQFWSVSRTLRNPLTDPGGPDCKPMTKEIRQLVIARADNRGQTTEPRDIGDGTIMIVKPSERGSAEPSRIAKLAYDKKSLTFEWENGMARDPSAAAEVLDSVLLVKCAGGETRYILLRDPAVKTARALPLDREKLAGNKRALTVAWTGFWASDRDALRKTELRFRIRRWRVLCKLPDQAAPVVFGCASSPDPPTVDRQSILHDSATLEIGIDPAHPAVISVRFQAEDRLKTQYEEMERRLTDLESRYSTKFLLGRGDLEGRVQDLRRAIDARRQSKNVATDLTDRAILNEDLAFLGDILTAAKTDAQVRALEAGEGSPELELSAAICVKLENGTIVDVARFGEFEAGGEE
jgi:hypothetical protein